MGDNRRGTLSDLRKGSFDKSARRFSRLDSRTGIHSFIPKGVMVNTNADVQEEIERNLNAQYITCKKISLL